MNKRYRAGRILAALFLFVALLGTGIGPARANTPVTDGWQTPPPIESKALHETQTYRVLLPKSYNQKPLQSYPLLIVLDGSRYGDMVASNARFLADEATQIPEHVIVAVDSHNRLRDFTPTDTDNWVGDGGAKFFLAFMRDELIPRLQKDYRLNGHRILWGHSAAGLFAMYTLYAAPDLFEARLVNDGSLDWDNKLPEKEVRAYLTKNNVPPQYLYMNSSYLRSTDNPKDNWFQAFADMLKASAPKQLRWTYEPRQDEIHTSIALEGSIHGLRDLYAGYMATEQTMFKGFDAVLKHYADIKGRVGAPDKIPESTLNYFGYLRLGQNTPEAIRAFEMATKLYPESADAWDSLSDGYLEARRPKDALKATDKSIALAKKYRLDSLKHFVKKRARIKAESHNSKT